MWKFDIDVVTRDMTLIAQWEESHNAPEIPVIKPMPEIRIIDLDFNLIAAIDNYESLIFERKLYSAGMFTIVLNYDILNATELKTNRIIMLDNDSHRVGIIKEVKYTQEGNLEKLTVKGFELKGILKQRITLPSPGDSHQRFTTMPYESLIKSLVQYQCRDIPDMAFANLEIATDKAQGSSLKFETRYKNVADELEKISRYVERGYTIYFDSSRKKWIFDILPTNKTGTIGERFPIFSAEYDNLERQEYTESVINTNNYAVVAGQGSGVDRTIVNVSSEIASDIFKNVTFVDARDLEDTIDLAPRGNLKLKEAAKIQSFDCDIYSNNVFVYGTDWDLGYTVNIVNKKMNVNEIKVVEEVTEYYQVGSERKIQAVFGNSSVGIKKYIDVKNDAGID
jgi:hypothetical protein